MVKNTDEDIPEEEIEDLTIEDVVGDAELPVIRYLSFNGKKRRVTFRKADYSLLALLQSYDPNDQVAKQNYLINLILKCSIKPKFEKPEDFNGRYGFVVGYGRLIERESAANPFLSNGQGILPLPKKEKDSQDS